MQNIKPHAALLVSPGMGHLIPVLELAKTLVDHHGWQVTIFAVPIDQASAAQAQLLQSPNPDLLNIVVLPTVETRVDPSAPLVTNLSVQTRESLPFLRNVISGMKVRPAMLVVDLFGAEAFAIADEFEMLKFVFNTSTAWFLAVVLYAPTLEREVIDEHVHHKKALKLPGCKPLRFEDTLEAFILIAAGDRVPNLGSEILKADGILVNTWDELEPTTVKTLGDNSQFWSGRVATVPVYPVGPLVRRVGSLVEGSHVMSWLDKQPAESVIYLSFGSGGTLSADQMRELASGLELSQQRFIWVVRRPVDNNASGSYFTVDHASPDGTSDYLPDGFFTRTHEVGLVVPMWAPQADILAHPSVGAFLSHCGWNSALESIVNGVPMVAWPLYAEQKMNAAMLTEDLCVAVRPKVSPSEELVLREEIKTLVKTIMVDEEGQRMKERAKELKHSAEVAMSDSGSSFKSLSRLTRACRRRMQYLK